MANEEDYFIAANSVGAINEEQYKKLDDTHPHDRSDITLSIPKCVSYRLLQERIPVCIRESFISFADILQKK